MDIFQTLRRSEEPVSEAIFLLERNYGQLLKWAKALTGGDVEAAQEVVQELCLYFALTRPDLTKVNNVQAYLYACLRNIYTSSMARTSREAERFLSVADFDSIQFALAAPTLEKLVHRQNQLRRICAYLLWRKESSKGACYLALLFLHGYSRSHVAEIARVPLAAVYNKVLIARGKLKSYIEDSSKLKLIKAGLLP